MLDLEGVPLRPEVLLGARVCQAGGVDEDGARAVDLAQPPLQRGVAHAQRARVAVGQRVRRLRLDRALVHLAHLRGRRVGIGNK